MKLMDRIRGLDQLQITILTVLVNAVISIVILAFYIYQGLTSDYFGYSDDYFEGAPASYGNLVFDILAAVFMAVVIFLIALAITKRQSRFLLAAVIFILTSIFLLQASYSFLSSVVICSFGYYYLKKEERDPNYQQSKRYLLKTAFSVYILDIIFYTIPLGGYLFDTIQSTVTPDLSGYEIDGEVPDWVLWGTEPANAGINVLGLALFVIPFILLLIATVFMHRAMKGQGNISSKLGATMFLLYPLTLTISLGELYSFILAMSLPEVLLSIYILFRRESRTGDLPVEKATDANNS